MKDPKAIKRLKEKTLADSLKKIEHPHLTGLAIAAFLYVLVVVVAIIAWAVSDVKFLSAMLTSGLIGIALSAIWLTLRWGMFASWRMRFVNYRNKKIAKGIAKPADVTFTKKEYADLSKQKSYYGMLALFIACAITVIVTAIIRFA